MKNVIKGLAALASVAAMASTTVFAADGSSRTLPEGREADRSEMKPSVAIFGGYSDTQTGRRNGTNYGAEYGFQPYIPLGAAVELSGYVSDHKGDVATLTRTRLLGKVNYNFGGTIPVIKNSYVGLGIGPIMDNVAHKVDVNFGIAPQIGFDIPIASTPLSLGANANYLFVGGAKPDVFALNGVLKYWF